MKTITISAKEERFITEALASKRNTLRRKANYDGVSIDRRASMRVKANEMERLIVKVESQS